MLHVFDSTASALAYLQPQLASIEAQVYQIRMPAIRYAGIVPVDTSANPLATSVVYYSGDIVGEARWKSSVANDTALADITRSQSSTAVHQAGIGYEYDDVELGQAKLLGIALTAEKAIAARKVAEKLIDKVAMEGEPSKGFSGIFSAPNVHVAASGGAWIGRAAAEVLAEFNSMITGVYLDSDTVEMADTVLLPVATHAYLSSTPFNSYSDMTLLDYLKKANVYTAATDRPLTVRGVRGLDTAGVGGTSRAIAYCNDKDVVRLHMPMPFQFGNAREKAAWLFEVPGRMRLGGVDVRRPGAFRYTDGV